MPKTSQKKTTPKKTSQKTSPAAEKSRKALPGYVRFALEVFQLLTRHRGVFSRLLLLLLVVSIAVVGVTQQAQYQDVSDMSDVFSEQFATGMYRGFIEVTTVFISVAGGSLTTALTESQQIYMTMLYVFTWLVVVWLLRHQLAGTAVKLRDGLYNAGAPFLTTVTIVLVGVIQLLPLALSVSLFSSLLSSGILQGVAAIVLASVVILGLGTLSLYWLASTYFAALIVTIPGTYPWSALRSAKQLITGYRLTVLLRLVWLGLLSFIVFTLLTVPFILLDAVLGHSLSFVVAVAVQLVTIMLYVYGAAYMYLLYRRIIDERA